MTTAQSTTARERQRRTKPAPNTEAAHRARVLAEDQEVKDQKFRVRLRKGRRYHLIRGEGDIIFERGQPVEVSEEVYTHLAAHAVDVQTTHDASGATVQRSIRKFGFQPELPRIAAEVTVRDGITVEETDDGEW